MQKYGSYELFSLLFFFFILRSYLYSRILDYVLVYTEEEDRPIDPVQLRFRNTFLENLEKRSVAVEKVRQFNVFSV